MHAHLRLKIIAAEIRKNILEMTHRAQFGYLGGSLSCVEILTSLFFGKMDTLNIMNYDAAKPGSPDQDYFILSKAHATAALYSILAKANFFSAEELNHYGKLGSLLKAYPTNRIKGIKIAPGSPGEGLSLGNGLALGSKLDKSLSRVFILIGDGELQEGQIFEAIMTSSQNKLDNICAIIDNNEMQRDGYIKGIKDVEPIQDKFEACGWKVIKIVDGHDFEELLKAFRLSKKTERQPTLIIAPTIKGKGIPFMEKNSSYHRSFLSDTELSHALTVINAELKELNLRKELENR